MADLKGEISTPQPLIGEIKLAGVPPNLQEKTVAPSISAQEITADSGYDGLSRVIVEAIPRNYGLITYSGYELTIS